MRRSSGRSCRLAEVPLFPPSLPPSLSPSRLHSKTAMTMTKNNSAAAETAPPPPQPPNCHVALVPPSNCAVDRRTSDPRNVSDISLFLQFFHAKFPMSRREGVNLFVCIRGGIRYLWGTLFGVSIQSRTSTADSPSSLRRPTPFPGGKNHRDGH